MIKYIFGLLSLILMVNISNASIAPQFCVYYADQEPDLAFKPCQWIVFDSSYHPQIKPLISQDKIVLGYLSIGEIESIRGHFTSAKSQDLLLQENKIWKGSYFVDLRKPEWAEILIEKEIPRILNQGFNGIFLDTLDNPIELESSDPKKYSGMKDAAINLVKWIHTHYPKTKIMVNRAYPLLPEIAPYINYVLAESLYTTYNFNTKKYSIRPQKDYFKDVAYLQKLNKKHPNLQIFTLDYWYPSDTKTIQNIYEMEQKNGFTPYVSTILLNKLYVEKKA